MTYTEAYGIPQRKAHQILRQAWKSESTFPGSPKHPRRIFASCQGFAVAVSAHSSATLGATVCIAGALLVHMRSHWHAPNQGFANASAGRSGVSGPAGGRSHPARAVRRQRCRARRSGSSVPAGSRIAARGSSEAVALHNIPEGVTLAVATFAATKSRVQARGGV